jgi:HK97 gp10 family phage protein
MADVHFEDYSMEVEGALNDAVIAFLHEAAGEMEAQVKRNTPVDTGQLKGSWEYKVDENKGEAVIGSPLENAIWNEFGTGQYALHGDGRKTPWHWQDIKGKWHTTTGKRPQRSLYYAFERLKHKIQSTLANKLKEGMK